jgi:hypothetical protein
MRFFSAVRCRTRCSRQLADIKTFQRARPRDDIAILVIEATP